MTVNTNIYDRRFFQNTIQLEGASARAVVEILIKHFHPHSVIDIGCGAGIYLREFAQKGVDILGYDGSPVALEESLVGEKIKLHDLEKPLYLDRKFDLCLCFEVAEHLPFRSSEILVDTLTRLSPIIVFTAATPGQGPESIGHINEQPHDFWISLFERKAFHIDKEVTEDIKKEMKEKNVVWWITKNLMVFKKNEPKKKKN